MRRREITSEEHTEFKHKREIRGRRNVDILGRENSKRKIANVKGMGNFFLM